MKRILKKIVKAPEKPGVYIFKNNQGEVLYIGKAKRLKNRLKSYLSSNSLKIKKLLEESYDIEWIETNSEGEAILKESELIKKFNPPFNHLLRDDTNFFYVIFTKELFPKVIITHQPYKYAYSEIIGPFLEGTALKSTLHIIRKFLPFCTCKNFHYRECLNSNLNLCFGYCCQKQAKYEKQDIKNYQKNLKLIKNILKGDFQNLKKQLLSQIKNNLTRNQLENALRLKKAYLAIKKVEEQSNLIKEKEKIEVDTELRKILTDLKNLLKLKKIPEKIEVYDISHFAGREKVGIMVSFVNGEYNPELKRKFKIKSTPTANDPKMIYEIIKRRLKHLEWGLPDLIVVDGGQAQRNFAEKAIQEFNFQIKIISFAKPKQEIYYAKNKKPIPLQNLPPTLQKFIKRLDLTAHKNVIKYHRKRREKLNNEIVD